MKKLFILIVTFLFHLPQPAVISADSDCPEIDIALRRAIYNAFPTYELASDNKVPAQERQELDNLGMDECPYLVALDPSTLMLVLREKKTGDFSVVLATFFSDKGQAEWIVRKVDVFQGDMPILQKARGGFYLDVTTRKKMIVTRSSVAVQANCQSSGRQFIFKVLDDGKVEGCRIK